MTPYKPAADSPFSVPLFRTIWISSLAMQFGGQIQGVGAAWMMASMKASPQLIALIQTSTSLPILLFALLAGALADSVDRRRIMITAQLFMLCCSIGLSVLTALGLLTPWLLLAFTFLIACGSAFNAPSWQASVGDIVPRPLLTGAVAMNSMGFNLARSLGPAIGGALVASAGAAAAFLVNALSYIPVSIAFARWKPPVRPRSGPPEPFHQAIGSGLRFVAMSPPIGRAMLRGALFGFGSTPVVALMPVVARDVIGGGPLVFGALSAAFGVGAVSGAVATQRLRRRFSSETLIRVASVCIAAGAIVAGLSHVLVLTMVGLLAAGVGWVLGFSTCNVSVQLASPRWVVGRALSIYQTAMFGGVAAGSAGFGWVAQHWGITAGLLGAGAWCAMSGAAGVFAPLPKLEMLDLDPLDRWSEPSTPVPVEPRSGPVFISIAYQVPPERLEAFTAAMAERRRIRRRDGAQDWRLTRDLARPDTWIEMYRTPTWADYVRHNQRRTKADADNADLLLQLHAGAAPPEVTRLVQSSRLAPRTTEAAELAEASAAAS